ncbi:hypothetical protein [Bacteroidetes bacterium endosymbiont of Geopemphigus sp.]|uniref:hypothetical protein n=1 Tax=Bacteroidetes bacterium endosymbiont of Geopemphigus sp. TaxID=2047937 RepID=UPI000CD19861|nr:hypothetical protein [Bacteroidetes bacterium endosymbiont of Geopemphigus sp.]
MNIKKGIKSIIYDPKSGTTADQDGSYKLAYKFQLVNDPFGGSFNGTSGRFGTWIHHKQRTRKFNTGATYL